MDALQRTVGDLGGDEGRPGTHASAKSCPQAQLRAKRRHGFDRSAQSLRRSLSFGTVHVKTLRSQKLRIRVRQCC